MHSEPPPDEQFDARPLLSAEGQIVFLLLYQDLPAGSIYQNVRASQPTISKKLSDLVYRNIIRARNLETDRRITIYSISPAIRDSIYNCMAKLSDMLTIDNKFDN
jgi:DNA-binding MarR family transcriptional regulator